MGLDHTEPNANLLEHLLWAASCSYLLVAGLNIEHWRKVALQELGVLDEMLSLGCTRAFEREEM